MELGNVTGYSLSTNGQMPYDSTDGAGVKREPCLWRGALILELGRRYLMPLNCLSKVANYT